MGEDLIVKSTADIMDARKEMFRDVLQQVMHFSPQHAIDIHTRMLRRTKTTRNNAVPRATADIGDANHIIVVKEPIVDKNVAVASSIRKVNLAAASEDILLDNDSLTPEMMDFLILCLAHGVSICISGETGTGKTTLGGCLLAIASRMLRIWLDPGTDAGVSFSAGAGKAAPLTAGPP